MAKKTYGKTAGGVAMTDELVASWPVRHAKKGLKQAVVGLKAFRATRKLA